MLKVTDLDKFYKTYSNQAFRFFEMISGGLLKRHHKNWVLKDINFEVHKGQFVGIVGRNGAGKSTLLKVISGTTKPNRGDVECGGRIAAILELGIGFDPELTGRQNAVIGLHLIGINGEEIHPKIIAIEAFAELGDYFDQATRIYSSGMLVRLAFSIATSVEPDLLIVDEALSVGDAYFQQKCAFVLDEYKRKGGTLLFVSHDPNTIKSLCDSAILLDGGRLIMSGSPKSVIDFYQANILALGERGEGSVKFYTAKDRQMPLKATSITTNGDAELLDFNLFDIDGAIISAIESEEVLIVEYLVKLNKDFVRPAFGLIIRNRLGTSMFETSTYGQRMPERPLREGTLVTVKFQIKFNLFQGQYSFSVGVSNKGYSKSEFEEVSLLVHDVWQIQVLESSEAKYYGGVYNMKPEITVMF